MYRGTLGNQLHDGAISSRSLGRRHFDATLIKRLLRRMPRLVRFLKSSYLLEKRLWGELRHGARGYRFLREKDLLIVSGGGQLDEEWGGPWGHPFALFKWAVLARMARVPFAFASVGACKVTSAPTKFFLGAALRMARYRSYRDNNSRRIAGSLFGRAADDSVVPDLAFSLRSEEFPAPAGIRSISQGRTVVAISPIAFAKDGSWPWKNPALHDRYVRQMTRVLSQLLKRGYFLVIVCSSLGDDESVIAELLDRADDEARKRYARQLHRPRITAWQHVTASLLEADLLIASRLHSAILGFVTETPTIAISFDPKVDWLMQDLGLTDYLLHIKDFTADDVIAALSRVETRRAAIVRQITSYRQQCSSGFERQYDALAGLAMASSNHSNSVI
jgi:polysaccharide pyruvyl transferase WcaK-like protein